MTPENWRPVAGRPGVQQDALTGSYRHRPAAGLPWLPGLPQEAGRPVSWVDNARSSGRRMLRVLTIVAAGYVLALGAAPAPDRKAIAVRLEASGKAWRVFVDSH